MDLDKIFEQLKEELKDEMLSEGSFKALVNNNTELETPVILLKSGGLIPKNWEIFEEVIFGFEGIDEFKVVFENNNGQFPCLCYESDSSPMIAIMPGVQLPKNLEDNLTKMFSGATIPKAVEEIGITREVWDEYISSRSSQAQTPKLK